MLSNEYFCDLFAFDIFAVPELERFILPNTTCASKRCMMHTDLVVDFLRVFVLPAAYGGILWMATIQQPHHVFGSHKLSIVILFELKALL